MNKRKRSCMHAKKHYDGDKYILWMRIIEEAKKITKMGGGHIAFVPRVVKEEEEMEDDTEGQDIEVHI